MEPLQPWRSIIPGESYALALPMHPKTKFSHFALWAYLMQTNQT